MPDLGKNDVVLRLWTVSDAPPNVQQALGEIDSNSWVAQVPPELLDEPLVALLVMNASKSGALRKVLLPNGTVLFAGPIEPSPSDHARREGATPESSPRHVSG